MSAAEAGPALPPWAVVGSARVAHIARVVVLVERFARERGVPAVERDRWRRAAILHDALRDAPADVLRRYEPHHAGSVKTWHGPAAAAAAAADGERDAGVLDAVRYHSLGYAGWDEAGRMLYLADYLEPGRTHQRRKLDALLRRVASEPGAVLREVAAMRIGWRLSQGGRVARETWEFWNGLVAAPSS
jgi:HD superfamily phosphohydrolase YqeK